jgi:hypothetical protein
MGAANPAPKPVAPARNRCGTRRYRLYGLVVQSPLSLPCPLAKPHVRADVCLGAGRADRFARARSQIAAPRPQDWFGCHRLADGTTYLQWSGLFEFLISPDGRLILYHRLNRSRLESFTTYLLGQVLSFSLLSLGVEALHGTVVVVDGAAIAFLGDCGYGKSTLGAAFVARGVPMLTDDLIVAEEGDTGWAVHPGIPRIKLFPSVARRLLGKHLGGTPLNDGTSKLVLPLKEGQVVRRITPLTAIYVLSDPERGKSRGSTLPKIERLSGREAFFEIVRAAFNPVVVERPRLTNHFRFATRLLTTARICRLTYSRRFSSLPAVCDAVLSDVSR